MNNIITLKNILCTAAGIAGAFVSQFLGGWTGTMTTLVIFMGLDYITGLIVAGVFHNSSKSESG
ncbi:MAG: phage holin family protein, partial [Candidatus Ornithomonoglobus sp.]